MKLVRPRERVIIKKGKEMRMAHERRIKKGDISLGWKAPKCTLGRIWVRSVLWYILISFCGSSKVTLEFVILHHSHWHLNVIHLCELYKLFWWCRLIYILWIMWCSIWWCVEQYIFYLIKLNLNSSSLCWEIVWIMCGLGWYVMCGMGYVLIFVCWFE